VGESTFYLQTPEKAEINDKTPPPERAIERLDHELQVRRQEKALSIEHDTFTFVDNAFLVETNS
jgi:hypothetical protein